MTLSYCTSIILKKEMDTSGGVGGLAPVSLTPEPECVIILRSQGIDSQSGGPVRQHCLTYRPARLHRQAELIPWIRFLGSWNVYKFGLCNDWSLELSIFCCKWRIIQTTIVCYNDTNSYRYCGKVWMTQSQIKNLRKLGKTFCKSSMYFYSNINQHHCL